MSPIRDRRWSQCRWGLSLALAGAAALSGCYVVPLNAGVPATAAVAAPVATPLTLGVRLYPSNDLAAPLGVVSAQVSSDLNGHGRFTASIAGESFSGEATRQRGSLQSGLANGSGSRGSYLSCHYTMNHPTQGSGECELSNGARFAMHVGS